MTTFNRSKFKKLSEFKGANAFSIYIPAEDGGDNRNKAMTKLKNHVQDAERELETMGLKPREIEDFLKPVNGLLNDAARFRNLDRSLAVVGVTQTSKIILCYRSLIRKIRSSSFRLVKTRTDFLSYTARDF